MTAAAATQLVVPALDTTILTGTAGGSQHPDRPDRRRRSRLQVLAEDPYGNVAPNFNGSVALALEPNPGGASLGGTLTVAAVNGVATFSGLSIKQPGSGYTLQATSSGLTAGIGPAFNVTNDQLVVTTQPPATVTAGTPFGVVVAAENAAGSVDTSFNGSITLSDSHFRRRSWAERRP